MFVVRVWYPLTRLKQVKVGFAQGRKGTAAHKRRQNGLKLSPLDFPLKTLVCGRDGRGNFALMVLI